MAARRERDRRRPGGERQYRFVTPEPAVAPDETVVEQDEEASESVQTPPPSSSAARSAAVATPAPPRVSTRTTRPFSAYKEEYGYVYGDLRRVGVVVGSLLAVLIVLYFVLPLLVR